LLGEGIAGAYVIEHPEFSSADENHQDEWLRVFVSSTFRDMPFDKLRVNTPSGASWPVACSTRR